MVYVREMGYLATDLIVSITELSNVGKNSRSESFTTNVM